MSFLEDIFKFKSFDKQKLLQFGFSANGDEFTYSVEIMENLFVLKISVQNNNLDFQVFDSEYGDAYNLIKVSDAEGSFIGKMRSEIEKIFLEIAEKCTFSEIFKNAQTKRVIAFVQAFFQDEPEYLWQKFPDNAVFRRKDTKKWYGAILNCKPKNLGLSLDTPLEVLDFRMEQEKLSQIVDNRLFWTGFHMNKKHWCTIILNDSLDDELVFSLLKDSYKLAK